MLRTQSVENLMKVHRLFMCGNCITNIFASMGLFILLRHISEWSELICFLIAGGVFTVLSVIITAIFDRALVRMYNDWLIKDTVNMFEMITTGDIIPDESYEKFAEQLCKLKQKSD